MKNDARNKYSESLREMRMAEAEMKYYLELSREYRKRRDRAWGVAVRAATRLGIEPPKKLSIR